MTLRELVQQAYAMAKDKGFHEKPVNIDQKLMLVVSELAEAQEELRDGRTPTEVYTKQVSGMRRVLDPTNVQESPLPKPEGFGVELADAVIRIADLCGVLNIDLEACIATKLQYNATRPEKHGRQF